MRSSYPLSYKNYLSIEYLFLFLCSIEFLSKFYSIFLLFFFVLFIRNKIPSRAFSQRSFLWISVFSLCYFVFAPSDLPTVVYPVWIAAYIIGYSMATSKYELFKILFIIALGHGVHGFLICIANIGSGGVDALGERVLLDIWGGGLRATQECSFLVFSAICVTLFTIRESKWYKIIAVLFIIGTIFNAISTATRSGLVYPLIIILVSLLPYASNSKKNFFLRVVLISIFLLVLYHFDFLGSRSFFERQYLYTRFVEKDGGGIVNNQRKDFWIEILHHFNDYIWGGGYGTRGDRDYAHNIILDVFVTGGLLPAIFIISIVLRSIKMDLRLYKLADSFEKSFVIGAIVAFLGISMTEPIIQGANWFFTMYLVFVGCLERRCESIGMSQENYIDEER